MPIFEYRSDSSPPAVLKRILRKNDKTGLALAIRGIWDIQNSETLSDSEKLKQIEDKIAGVLF